VQFAINISEKPSASAFWCSAFKDFYPQYGVTWVLKNVGTYLPNYRAPQTRRHIFFMTSRCDTRTAERKQGCSVTS